METCGADPRGVRVEWHDGGGPTHLVAVTELGRMLGNDPNLALSVLHGLGTWEAGVSAGGMDPQRKGCVTVQDREGETGSSSSSSTIGERTPPPGGPQTLTPPKPSKKKPRHFESSEQEAPRPKAKPSPGPRARARPRPPPKPQAPPLEDRGRDPYGNVPGVGATRYVPWKEGGDGGTVSQVTVLGDGDEELDPGEWWVVSQGSNGEGGKEGEGEEAGERGGHLPGAGGAPLSHLGGGGGPAPRGLAGGGQRGRRG